MNNPQEILQNKIVAVLVKNNAVNEDSGIYKKNLLRLTNLYDKEIGHNLEPKVRSAFTILSKACRRLEVAEWIKEKRKGKGRIVYLSSDWADKLVNHLSKFVSGAVEIANLPARYNLSEQDKIMLRKSFQNKDFWEEVDMHGWRLWFFIVYHALLKGTKEINKSYLETLNKKQQSFDEKITSIFYRIILFNGLNDFLKRYAKFELTNFKISPEGYLLTTTKAIYKKTTKDRMS